MRWDQIVGALAAAYFLARVAFFACTLSPAIPPDETTHLGRVLVFAASATLPQDGPETWELGPVTQVPVLYYWLMGRLSHLNLFGVPELLFLRLLNLPLAALTLGFAWKAVSVLSSTPAVRAMFIVILTNTMMLSVLFGSVSYDNLTNLLAAASAYYLFAFLRAPRSEWALKLGLAMLLGSLTKETFLPLAALICVAVAVRLAPGGSHPVAGLYADFRRLGTRGIVLAGLCLPLILANLALYAGNLLAFGRLVPRADHVLGLEHALENRIFARDWIRHAYADGELEYEEAMHRARAIRGPSERVSTQILVDLARERPATLPLANPALYAVYWLVQMTRTMHGLAGHASLLKNRWVDLAPYLLVLAAALLLVARDAWRRPGERAAELGASFVAAGYALILLWAVNYPVYLDSAHPMLGLQGRYAFVVLVPVCALVAQGLGGLLPQRTAMLLLVGVSCFFVLGDFPFFLEHAGPEWFVR